MGRRTRALQAHGLLARAGAPVHGLGWALRRAGLTLVLLGAVALAAWSAHDAVAARDGWLVTLVHTVQSWLRAAWSAGG